MSKGHPLFLHTMQYSEDASPPLTKLIDISNAKKKQLQKTVSPNAQIELEYRSLYDRYFEHS